MMLEMSEDQTFGVLSPAFKGCEVDFARQIYAEQSCTFLKNERCELFSSGLQPLECRHCHHSRPDSGKLCHRDIALEWNSPAGKDLVVLWSKKTGFWDRIQHLLQQGK